MHELNLRRDITRYVKSYLATGSSVICDPPVLDTDRDFVLLVAPEHAAYVENELVLCGYEDCAKRDGDVCRIETSTDDWDGTTLMFICRKDDINLMVCYDERLFECWRISTKRATRFNLLNKIDRQDLFSAIRDRRLVSESVS